MTWPTEFGVSAERIRQIEAKAMEKMSGADGDGLIGSQRQQQKPRTCRGFFLCTLFLTSAAGGCRAAAPAPGAVLREQAQPALADRTRRCRRNDPCV